MNESKLSIAQDARDYVEDLIKRKGVPQNVEYYGGAVKYNYGFGGMCDITDIFMTPATENSGSYIISDCSKYKKSNYYGGVSLDLSDIDFKNISGVRLSKHYKTETMTKEELWKRKKYILDLIHENIRKRIGKLEIVSSDITVSIKESIDEYMRAFLKLNYQRFYSWNSHWRDGAKAYITFPIKIGIRSIMLEVTRQQENDFNLEFAIYGNSYNQELKFNNKFISTYGDNTIRNYLSKMIRDYIKKFYDRLCKGESLFEE